MYALDIRLKVYKVLVDTRTVCIMKAMKESFVSEDGFQWTCATFTTNPLRASPDICSYSFNLLSCVKANAKKILWQLCWWCSTSTIIDMNLHISISCIGCSSVSLAVKQSSVHVHARCLISNLHFPMLAGQTPHETCIVNMQKYSQHLYIHRKSQHIFSQTSTDQTYKSSQKTS